MLYMIVTNDKLELPAAIDLNFEQVCEWLNLPPETLRLKLSGESFWGSAFKAVEQPPEKSLDYMDLHGEERQRAYIKAYLELNKDALNEKKRQKYAALSDEEKEKKRAYQRAYREKHKERVAEYAAKYRRENREKIRERMKEYCDRHKEELQAYAKERYRKKKEAEA